MNHSTPGLPVHHQLPEFTQTHVHCVSDAIQPSHPLSSLSPPALNLPSIRVFSNESALHIRWPKYWRFSFNISPSNEHPGPISFRMDWLDLFVVQGTLKGLLQHHSSKASRNANQNHNEVLSHAAQNVHHQKVYNNKFWRGCGEMGTPLHCWWECKLVHPVWRTVWRFFKNWK